jgi:CRISPR-associated protein Cmr2
MKRAGATTHLTSGWGFGGPKGAQTRVETTPIGVLLRLRDTLALPEVSRRAVFQILSWLPGMPVAASPVGDPSYRRLLGDTIAYQLIRQDRLGSRRGDQHRQLGAAMVEVALQQRPDNVPAFLAGLLDTAEMLAREGRALVPPPSLAVLPEEPEAQEVAP